MSNSLIKFYKETTVPGSFEKHSVYFVAPTGSQDYVEVYVSDSTGSKLRRVLNERDIKALISASLTAANNIKVVEDIAARDRLQPETTLHVYVKDASADSTVNAGGATYLYDIEQTAWVKVSEAESMDIRTTWAALDGKPTSSTGEIDQAVALKHSHTNMTQLNKIGEDGTGNLTYNGKSVSTSWTTTGW